MPPRHKNFTACSAKAWVSLPGRVTVAILFEEGMGVRVHFAKHIVLRDPSSATMTRMLLHGFLRTVFNTRRNTSGNPVHFSICTLHDTIFLFAHFLLPILKSGAYLPVRCSYQWLPLEWSSCQVRLHGYHGEVKTVYPTCKSGLQYRNLTCVRAVDLKQCIRGQQPMTPIPYVTCGTVPIGTLICKVMS
ncbi:uncharacterized protein TNCV_895051 [Trichonephila clavipes]|nr:uncharacterized protein TNCV_895051 [Trichonephila clavipes]